MVLGQGHKAPLFNVRNEANTLDGSSNKLNVMTFRWGVAVAFSTPLVTRLSYSNY